jgi:hypothetical protein
MIVTNEDILTTTKVNMNEENKESGNKVLKNPNKISNHLLKITVQLCTVVIFKYLFKVTCKLSCKLKIVSKNFIIKCKRTNKCLYKQLKQICYYYLYDTTMSSRRKKFKHKYNMKKLKARKCRNNNVNTNQNNLLMKVKNTMITSLIIFLLLICHGVEINPGPPGGDLKILTYNCNGLGDRRKLKSILTKLEKKVNNGAVVFLQETHLVNTEYMKTAWKNKFISNCKSTKSAGVIILYNDKYEVKYDYLDETGHQIVAVLKNDEKYFVVSNAYFPNDHKEAIRFAENLYLKILKAQASFPNNITICAGDYNACMSKEDSIGRVVGKTAMWSDWACHLAPRAKKRASKITHFRLIA